MLRPPPPKRPSRPRQPPPLNRYHPIRSWPLSAARRLPKAIWFWAAEELTQELQSIPADQRRGFLLTVIIDMKLMASAAREDGLDETDDFTRRLAYLEDQALRRAFFNSIVETQVTEEAIQAAYDETVAEFSPEPEVRARHGAHERRSQRNPCRNRGRP